MDKSKEDAVDFVTTIEDRDLRFGTKSEDEEILASISHSEYRKLVHRIDVRLIPAMGLMHCISLMDRSNVGAAMIAGMAQELRLTVGTRYSLIVLIFFVPYIIFQPAGTVLTRKIGPRIFLPSICIAWGLVLIGMGFVNDWGALAGLRVLVGLLESGYFPGCIYLLSTWYCRYDMGKRYSFFYVIGMLASACSGILAFGLMQMDGLADKRGWRWIFIMEGIITCLVAFVGFTFMIPFPDDKAHRVWGFLNKQEVDYIVAKVRADRGDTQTESFTLKKFLTPALDLKLWAFGFIYFCLAASGYSLVFFLPLLLRNGMGFGVGASQCLVAPPYAFAAILMFIWAWVGDKYKIRGPLIAINCIIAIVGVAVLGWAKSSGIRYFGVFLIVGPINASIPILLAYQANNIRGQWKRAFGSATLIGLSGVGGIAGSLVFRSQDAPNYIPGLWACIAVLLAALLTIGCLDAYFIIVNRRADRGEIAIEGTKDSFRYTL